MAKKWNLETDVNNKTMEELLMEVFGCISADKKIAKIYENNKKKRIKTEFYLAGNAMEIMLIEIFGCSSLDGSAIKIEEGKTKRKMKSEYCSKNYADNDFMMQIPINA
jgi:hypothetical protein